MTFASLMGILIMSMLINNVVLSQFLGLCPFLGVSKKINTAAAPVIKYVNQTNDFRLPRLGLPLTVSSASEKCR